MRLALSLLALTAAAGCGPASPPKAAEPPRLTKPRVAATLELPNAAGQVSIIEIPGPVLDVTRCVVATSATGAISTSCAPPTVDLQVDDR
jgi:hypothetical protein